MAVDSTNPAYDRQFPLWERVRDAAEGEHVVKGKGETYLPKLGGQDRDQYNRYKQRASFFNGTGRTIDGLSGMVFRKRPETYVPTSMQGFLEDVTLDGLDIQSFAECTTDEILKTGRSGILVDFPRVEVGGFTQAQAEQMNLRPFWSLYTAESILDWRTDRIGNRTKLTQVRLHEFHSEIGEDEFEEEGEEQIRVLDLTSDEGGRFFYRQRIFRQEKVNGEIVWVQQGDDIIPLMNGGKLDEIPFIFVGTKDLTPRVDKPPLIDLADKNFDHYRMDADYKHALHFIAAGSTRWVAGASKEEIENGVFDTVGPDALLASENPEAKFGISEPSGAGLSSQRQALEDAKQEMAALGARMLAPEKRAAEAAETASIHRQGEISVLASISLAISTALTKALALARDWIGIEGDVMIALNTDFNPVGMSAQDITALTKALQGGGISQVSYIEALQRGEVLRQDLTPDEEIQRLLTEGCEVIEPGDL